MVVCVYIHIHDEIIFSHKKERQIPYGFLYIWHLKTKPHRKLIDKEYRLVVARGGGWELGEMGESFLFLF